MERVMGIEPTYSAWKADVLPLNYTRIIKFYMAEPTGLEPATSGVTVQRELQLHHGSIFKMVLSVGYYLFHLTKKILKVLQMNINGAGERNRTLNPLITSQVLCQLSYTGKVHKATLNSALRQRWPGWPSIENATGRCVYFQWT
jgi:hypothetical protein